MTPNTSETLDPDAISRVEDRGHVSATEYFAFRIAGRVYALPALAVERVVLAQRIVRVPTTPTHVRGVVHLAGRILAVIDLAALLGLEHPEAGERIVLVSTRNYTFGAIVDAALGMWSVTAAPIAALDDGPLIRGTIESETNAAATLLDIDAILDRVLGGKR